MTHRGIPTIEECETADAYAFRLPSSAIKKVKQTRVVQYPAGSTWRLVMLHRMSKSFSMRLRFLFLGKHYVE
jgi:hypothetical protein